MIQFAQEEKDKSSACIKVVGVGGAGGNTVNRMITTNLEGVEFYAINTDAQALKASLATTKIQIGLKSAKGLGAGANPDAGKRAAEEDLDKVMQELSNADIVFVTGGMGGGTGSGAIPVFVKALKEKGILTIAVVTKPFDFEGKRRARITEQALDTIKAVADTLIIIPNQKLLDVADETVSMIDGFDMINEVLNQSVRSISEIITRPGHINVDFADVREIMKDKGLAVMGAARASGPGRAKKAALEAISSPLLETMSIAGARAVLLNITGGADLGLHEMSEAASVIYEQVDEDANIILGSVIENSMGNEVLVTVIATGFPDGQKAGVAKKVATQELSYQAALSSKEQYTPQAENHERIYQHQPYVSPAPEKRFDQPQEVKVVSFSEPIKTVEQAALLETEAVYKEQEVAYKEQPAKIEQVKACELEKEVSSAASCSVIYQGYEQKKAETVLSDEELFEQLLREEMLLEAQKQAVKPAEKVQEQISIQEHAVQEKSASAYQSHMIDINDLDVPAFMRKHIKEKQKND